MDLKKIYRKIGFPRLIISAFLILLLIVASIEYSYVWHFAGHIY